MPTSCPPSSSGTILRKKSALGTCTARGNDGWDQGREGRGPAWTPTWQCSQHLRCRTATVSTPGLCLATIGGFVQALPLPRPLCAQL